MLRWRLLLGTLIIAGLAALGWLDHQATAPGTWLWPVAVAFCVLGTSETLHLAAQGGMRPVGWIVQLGNLAILACQWLPLLPMTPAGLLRTTFATPAGFSASEATIWIAALVLMVVFLSEMARYRQPGGVTGNLAAATLAVIYVGVLLAFAVRLRLVWGVGALASLIIVVKMGDIGAYTVGRLCGRHKMAPVLSPGKTLEGAAGALVFALLGSWATFYGLLPWLTPGATSSQAAPWWGWIVFGLLVGAVGMLGDLAESLLKRDNHQKDSSTWMPGFGGILDILDSILMAAPIAYFCWMLGLVG